MPIVPEIVRSRRPQAARSSVGSTPSTPRCAACSFADGKPFGYHTSHVLYPPERF